MALTFPKYKSGPKFVIPKDGLIKTINVLSIESSIEFPVFLHAS